MRISDWSSDVCSSDLGSYQELASNPRVIEIIKGQIARVNRDLAGDPQPASCQVRRFLVLHKELDADDGELTRTRQVRRGFIPERYLPLLAALYSGAASAYIEPQVTFEDGRTGLPHRTAGRRGRKKGVTCV